MPRRPAPIRPIVGLVPDQTRCTASLDPAICKPKVGSSILSTGKSEFRSLAINIPKTKIDRAILLVPILTTLALGLMLMVAE